MADILQDFPIRVPPARVFEGVSAPHLLDQWWTIRSSGQPTIGSVYELDFGPGYQWRAVVTESVPGEGLRAAPGRLTPASRNYA